MLEPEPEAQQPALPAEDDSGLDGAGGSFAAGSSVALRGLQSQPELNGRIGVVRGFSQEKGRYTVEVDGRERAVRLKPSNVYIPTVPVDRTGTSAAGFFDIAPFMMPEDESDGTECAAERRLLAASWDATFRSVGFARIVGHGVSLTLISELRAAAGEFFARPEPDKMVYHRPAQPGRPLTGSFNPMFGCRAAAGGHDDPVEGYTFYRQYDGWRLSDPALAHPPELAAVAERYVEEVERVMHALHRLSAASLGLEPTFFDSAPDTKMSSLLVISHYPPTSGLEVDVADGQPRYRAHSDYTGFTILLQDEGDHEQVSEGAGDADADAARQGSAGGLEIDLDGQWTPVIPRAGSFVINIGDLFELWTNNRWRSTPHRVSSPSVGTAAASRSRITAMLFTGPSLETIVGPAPTCGPSLYPTVTARQHLTAMAISKSKESEYKSKEAAAAAAASSAAAAESAPTVAHE